MNQILFNRRKLELIIVAFLFASSCKETDVAKTETIRRLVSRKESITGRGSVGNWKFTYNDQGRLTSQLIVENGELTSFEYNNTSKLIKKSFPGTVTTYEYNAAGQLTKESLTLNDVLMETTSFEYNAPGQLVTQRRKFEDCPACGEWVINYSYPDETIRNPSSTASYDSNATNEILMDTYEYDDKPNPDRMLFDFPYLPENNVAKHVSIQSTPFLLESTTFYTYNYDAQGYPTIRTPTNPLLYFVTVKEYEYLPK